MGLPARKLRQDEHVEHSTSVDLSYPVECPALDTEDDVLHAYALLFFPAFARGNVGSVALHVTTDNGKTWPNVRQKKPSHGYVKKALISHLNAGKANEPWHLYREGKIHAIGARFRKDERTCILNIDLDGRTDVGEFVRIMGENGVHGLLTSSSGKPGKFRFLVFLDRWHTITEMNDLAKKLCVCLGFKVQSGAVEIYPSKVNGRLPGGYGALTVFDLSMLDVGVSLSLPAFLHTFYALPRVDLARTVDELKLSADELKLSAERDERLFSDIFPLFEQAEREHKRAENKQEPRKRGQTRVPKDVSRWLERGVEPGERDKALFELAKYARVQGKNLKETVHFLTDWIRQGGLARSRWMHEQSDAIERQIEDLPRIAANIFAHHGTFKRSAVNAPWAHLSAEDILALNADVERVVAMGKAKENNWTAHHVKAFVGAVLPFFKGACVDGHVDDQGRPIVRLHWERWEAAAGGGSDYAKLREAFNWFVPITGYLAAKWADNPDDAYAITWAFLPTLTSDAPKRALGSTWEFAVVAASKRQRRKGKARNA